MSDHIEPQMTADDLLEQIKARPRAFAKYIELLARAWADGEDAGWKNSWLLEPNWTHNPYKEAPFA